ILNGVGNWTGLDPARFQRRETRMIDEELLESVETPADDAAHLLVVDDDTRIRMLLHRFLRENGFRVTVAGDAADARRKLAGLEFDLLILDVMMPGEDGVSLTRSLREERDIPILMLTDR